MKSAFAVVACFIFLNSFSAKGQLVATNHIGNDCANNPHDFFAELDSGNVIILCWVMPCSGCINPSTYAGNIIQPYQASHPGKVRLYICDDAEDSPCGLIKNWCSANSIWSTAVFSDSTIRMTDYGSLGMPKIAVLGKNNHSVYYVAENVFNTSYLQHAIDQALISAPVPDFTGIETTGFLNSTFSIFPDPVNPSTIISYSLETSSDVEIQLLNSLGEKVKTVCSGKQSEGIHNLGLDSGDLRNGIYFLTIRSRTEVFTRRFIVLN